MSKFDFTLSINKFLIRLIKKFGSNIPPLRFKNYQNFPGSTRQEILPAWNWKIYHEVILGKTKIWIYVMRNSN